MCEQLAGLATGVGICDNAYCLFTRLLYWIPSLQVPARPRFWCQLVFVEPEMDCRRKFVFYGVILIFDAILRWKGQGSRMLGTKCENRLPCLSSNHESKIKRVHWQFYTSSNAVDHEKCVIFVIFVCPSVTTPSFAQNYDAIESCTYMSELPKGPWHT